MKTFEQFIKKEPKRKYYFINEFRKQLEIPFDNIHPLHGKPVHIHLKDFIEEIGNTKKNK